MLYNAIIFMIFISLIYIAYVLEKILSEIKARNSFLSIGLSNFNSKLDSESENISSILESAKEIEKGIFLIENYLGLEMKMDNDKNYRMVSEKLSEIIYRLPK